MLMKSWARTVLRPLAFARLAACSSSQYAQPLRPSSASPDVLQPAFFRIAFALLAITSGSIFFAISVPSVAPSGPTPHPILGRALCKGPASSEPGRAFSDLALQPLQELPDVDAVDEAVMDLHGERQLEAAVLFLDLPDGEAGDGVIVPGVGRVLDRGEVEPGHAGAEEVVVDPGRVDLQARGRLGGPLGLEAPLQEEAPVVGELEDREVQLAVGGVDGVGRMQAALLDDLPPVPAQPEGRGREDRAAEFVEEKVEDRCPRPLARGDEVRAAEAHRDVQRRRAEPLVELPAVAPLFEVLESAHRPRP